MTTTTEFIITDPFGLPVPAVTNYITADYVLNSSPGGVGVCELFLPLSFPTSLIRKHGRIYPWRSVSGRSPQLDNGAMYLIKYMKTSRQGTLVRGYHANCLAESRYILYDAGTTYTSKTGAADDLIKSFWNEQAGAGIVGADRDGDETQADISTYVSIQGSIAAAPSVQMSATREHLSTLMKRLCDASMIAGTYLTYEIYAINSTQLELRTYTQQRGIDRRAGNPGQLILSDLRANIQNVSFTYDWSQEVTFAVAAGQGQAAERLTQYSIDALTMSATPFGRWEGFFDHSNASNTTILQADADGMIRSSRAEIVAEGELVENANAIRGIHFDLGDIVSVENPVNGDQIAVRIDKIHEHFDSGGSDTVQPLSNQERTVRQTNIGMRSV